MERDGLVSGREVVQDTRPNKRLFTVTDAGPAELERFAASAGKPSFIPDDLLVKVQAADRVAAGTLIEQLTERAAFADAKIELLGGLLREMRGGMSEKEFLRHGERIGPYLTCLRGIAFEQGNRDWCRRSAAILEERRTAHARR
ncbi:PadR family transcriptional regulator [Nonomuraea diastatica]|uniref:PadR family transcriptional regulator n=1 Tax=Nonomuraea diastatica TaxID=1848329 RepID=A0A4R4WLB4_9ACTN|nr:PadR family transcriptional regulator [Nonomuraea diastatica]TDD17243.1 PadR family transcriptional regulator [Nonomuraea diastatica]